MPLTDAKIRNTKPTDKSQKLYDGGNLYLEIKPNNKRYWRYRYRIDGKENIYAIGDYPTMSLAVARTERDDAKKLVKQGIHPAHNRQLKLSQQVSENADTFRAIAAEWIEYENKRKNWTSTYLNQINKTFLTDVFPAIGNLPIRTITSAHILTILKKMEKRGAEVLAIMARQWCSNVFKYAISNLRTDNDPTYVLQGAIKRPKIRSNPPLPVELIPGFLNALKNYNGQRPTVIAIKLLMLTFVRTKELRESVWSEFDLEERLWKIPAERMKMREPHTVPLCDQAVSLLKELKQINGHQQWLFLNTRKPTTCMSATTINRALEYMGYSDIFSAHGFRTTASTILNELGYLPDVIEKQLAHKDSNRIRAIYNRAEYASERASMLQQWADYLDKMEEKYSKSK